MNLSGLLVIESRGLSKCTQGTQALKSLTLKVKQISILDFLRLNGAVKIAATKLLLGVDQSTGGSATGTRTGVGVAAAVVTSVPKKILLMLAFFVIASWRFQKEAF